MYGKAESTRINEGLSIQAGRQRCSSRGRICNGQKDTTPSNQPMATQMFISTSNTMPGEPSQLQQVCLTQPLNLFIIGNYQVNLEQSLSDLEAQPPTSETSTETAATATDSPSSNMTSIPTRLVLGSHRLLTLVVAPISAVPQFMLRKLLKIPGLVFRCIWSMSKTLLYFLCTALLLVAQLVYRILYMTTKGS